MNELRYTLITDGSSDIALVPILTWLLQTQGVNLPIQSVWADLRGVVWRGRPTLADKIKKGLELFPCDLLFIHRDAEREPREKRIEEIEAALSRLKATAVRAWPVVCVVPVRMQETWLLFDETAIKLAAGNRTYTKSLDLPPLKNLEEFPDPKSKLHDCLCRASGLAGRRLRSFSPSQRAQRVPEFTSDFAPLRALPAFAVLEQDIGCLVQRQGWDQ